MEVDAVPLAAFTPNFSSIPLMAPPPLGWFTLGKAFDDWLVEVGALEVEAVVEVDGAVLA